MHGYLRFECQSDTLLPQTPPCEENAAACFECVVIARGDSVLPAAVPKWDEARNLSVSGPREALARGSERPGRSPWGDRLDPSSGQCCSAVRRRGSINDAWRGGCANGGIAVFHVDTSMVWVGDGHWAPAWDSRIVRLNGLKDRRVSAISQPQNRGSSSNSTRPLIAIRFRRIQLRSNR